MISYLLAKRPKNINDLLDSKGELVISKISVCRIELRSRTRFVLSLLTFENYEDIVKRLNYDKLYHLYAIIQLEDGYTFMIEKNERVKIIHYNENKPNLTRCRTTNIKHRNITLRDFIENAENKSDENFYRYSATKYNCQRFILDLLTSNGINQYNYFIKQDVSDLFNSSISKFVDLVTDIAGIINYGYHGGIII